MTSNELINCILTAWAALIVCGIVSTFATPAKKETAIEQALSKTADSGDTALIVFNKSNENNIVNDVIPQNEILNQTVLTSEFVWIDFGKGRFFILFCRVFSFLFSNFASCIGAYPLPFSSSVGPKLPTVPPIFSGTAGHASSPKPWKNEDWWKDLHTPGKKISQSTPFYQQKELNGDGQATVISQNTVHSTLLEKIVETTTNLFYIF